ncbi:hypothetical protein TNCV_1558671 [Trichonephila clavipes]|nr:hypothetical protein TNCV_1558671 [Trichonephila clavipes]
MVFFSLVGVVGGIGWFVRSVDISSSVVELCLESCCVDWAFLSVELCLEPCCVDWAFLSVELCLESCCVDWAFLSVELCSNLQVEQSFAQFFSGLLMR